MRKKRIVSIRFVQTVFFSVVFMISGCATTKHIALTPQTKELNLQKESLALLTVRTSNQYKPGYQPDIWAVMVVTNDNKDNKETFKFAEKWSLKPYDKAAEQFNEYLLSMSLPAGKYKLRSINGTGGRFPVRGQFVIPVFADFELAPNKIIYLGRIEATLRERKSDNELRGGPVIPLIDQAATGFYAGTFDINIYDNYDKDIPLFKGKYPLLNNFTIENAVLSPWKQPSDQELKE